MPSDSSAPVRGSPEDERRSLEAARVLAETFGREIVAPLAKSQSDVAREQATVQQTSIAANKEVALKQLEFAQTREARQANTTRLLLAIPALMVVVAGIGYLVKGDTVFATEVFKLVLYGGGGFAAGWGVAQRRPQPKK